MWCPWGRGSGGHPVPGSPHWVASHPKLGLHNCFVVTVLATAGWRYPAGASLGGGWGRLAGLAGAPLRFTEWPRPHGRAALSPGLCRVTASGELGSGPGSREETVEREGGGGENADGGERRRGTDRMERRGDGETGGTERARRRQCLLPVATWLQSRVASRSRPPPPNWVQGDNADLTPQWEVGRMSVCHGSGRREEGWQVGDGWMGGGRRDRGTLSGKSKPRLMPRPIAPGAW